MNPAPPKMVRLPHSALDVLPQWSIIYKGISPTPQGFLENRHLPWPSWVNTVVTADNANIQL